MSLFRSHRETDRALSRHASLIFGLRVCLIVLLSGIGCFLWWRLGPEKPQTDEQRKQMAHRMAENAIVKIRSERGQLQSVRLVHFANDPTDCVTDAFRAVIDETGVLTLADRRFGEKVRSLLRMREASCASASAAVKYAGPGTDSVLWGKVERFESIGEGAALKGKWMLLQVPFGTTICEGEFVENTIDAVPTSASTEKSEIGKSTHRLICLMTILLLPIVTLPWIRRLVAKRSNTVNALTLGGYTLVDLILIFLLTNITFATTGCVLLFLFWGILAFIYNAVVMNYALRLTE
ncbi:MAG: hypothetical protein IKR48_06585 [Kiritimatiellae bacterium]|nr:hypothetical protein [Kiritimatiellia bacterium]